MDSDDFPFDRAAPESTSGADFDAALAQAEALLEQIDWADRRVANLTGLAVAGVAFELALATVLSVASVSGVSRLVLLLGAVAVAVAVVLAVDRVAIRPLRRSCARDERAMIEIVDLLREVLPFVTKRENWSNTRYQVARTRIARFPIGLRG